MHLMIVILSLHLATAIQGDSEDDEFQLAIERALNTPQNLLELQNSFLQGGDNPAVQCVLVNYTLTYNQEPCQNGTSINCTSNYSALFLWTTFDTKSLKGFFLLPWAVVGIRVLSFDWAYLCKVSGEDRVFLYLDISSDDTLHSTSEKPLTDILTITTKKLKAYARSEDMPSIDGYAIIWDEKGRSRLTDGEIVLYCTAPLLSILALLVMISVGNKLFDWIHEYVKDKTNYFLYFWSAQLLGIFFVIWVSCSLTGSKLGAVIFFYVYILLLVGLFIAFLIFLFGGKKKEKLIAFFTKVFGSKKKELIPVPFISCCTCSYSDTCKVLANIFAFANTFAFFTYLLYSAPSILLAFYVFPTRTIVRLSFFNFAVIVLLVVVSLFLFTLEKLCFLCFCKRRDQCEHQTEQDPRVPHVDRPPASPLLLRTPVQVEDGTAPSIPHPEGECATQAQVEESECTSPIPPRTSSLQEEDGAERPQPIPLRIYLQEDGAERPSPIPLRIYLQVEESECPPPIPPRKKSLQVGESECPPPIPPRKASLQVKDGAERPQPIPPRTSSLQEDGAERPQPIPPRIYYLYLQVEDGAAPPIHRKPSQGGSEQGQERGVPQAQHSDETLLPDTNSSDFPAVKISTSDIFVVSVQMVTALLIVIVATILLLAIGVVVFEETSDSTKTINEYLTIIPTIVVNVTIWLTGKKDFIPEEFKSLMYHDAERVRDALRRRRTLVRSERQRNSQDIAGDGGSAS